MGSVTQETPHPHSPGCYKSPEKREQNRLNLFFLNKFLIEPENDSGCQNQANIVFNNRQQNAENLLQGRRQHMVGQQHGEHNHCQDDDQSQPGALINRPAAAVGLIAGR